MARKGAVRVSITADSSDLRREVGAAERIVSRFGKTGHSSFKVLGSAAQAASPRIGRVAAAAGAAGAAFVGISEAKAAITTTEDLAKATEGLTNNLKISVRTASEWAAVAKVRGIEAGALTQQFGILAKNEQLAKDGAQAQVDAFAKLGISQKELKNQTFNQTLGEISDGMKELGKGTERTKVSQDIFGRGWKGIVPILRAGSHEMDRLLKSARDSGAVFSGKTLSSVHNLRKAMEQQKFAVLGLQVAFGTTLAPALTKIIPAVAKFINQIRTGKGAGGNFASSVKDIADAFIKVGKWVLNAVHNIDRFGDGTRHVIFGVIHVFGKMLNAIGDVLDVAARLPIVGRKFKGMGDAAHAAGDKLEGLGVKSNKAKGYLDQLTGKRWKVGVDLDIVAKSGIQGFKPLQPLSSLGRQIGGMIPGWGDGDKVPVLAEPGEGFINKRAVQAIGGPQAIDAINRAVPRFQRGGAVDTWRLGANSAGGTNQVVKNNARLLQRAFGGGGGPAGMVAAANALEKAHFPYVWGGGHQASPAPFGPMDCSGAVSFVLQHGGVNIPTMVSGALAGAGQPGPGRVTVFANDTHTFMRIGNRYFGTSGSNPGGGAGWFPDPGEAYRARFTQRHFGAGTRAARALGPPRGRGDDGDPGPRGGPHQRGGAHFRRGGMVGFQNGGMVKALHALHRAGATGAEEATLGAIAGAESGWRFVRGDGGQSWSPWQIYQPSWGDTIKRLGINIGTWGGAAKMALYIARNSGYDSWTTFRNGAYRPFLSRVERDISGGRNTGRIRGARPKKKKITPAQQRRLDRQSRRRSRARTGAEGLDPWYQAFDQNIQYKLAQAELTPSKADDIRVQSEAIGGYQGFLNVAKRRHDQATATSAAQSLKAARDARDELLRGDDTSGGGGNPVADAMADLAAQTKELADINKERAAFEKSIAYTSKEVAIKALSDVISGQIGGFTNQRRATAGDGATIARY